MDAGRIDPAHIINKYAEKLAASHAREIRLEVALSGALTRCAEAERDRDQLMEQLAAVEAENNEWRNA